MFLPKTSVILINRLFVKESWFSILEVVPTATLKKTVSPMQPFISVSITYNSYYSQFSLFNLRDT